MPHELPVGQVLQGDCLDIMRGWPDACVDCCVTSPPYYGLRDYGVDGQLGLERTPQEYIAAMVAVFDEVRRVLKPEGTLWLNIGDSFASGSNNGGFSDKSTLAGFTSANVKGRRQNTAGESCPLDSGLKPKDLCMIPARLALALQDAGWWLRSDIIWAKPNPMPESVTDRPTSAHEHIFLLAKSERYYYDAAAIAEEASGRVPGNKTPTADRDTGIEHAANGHGIYAAQQKEWKERNARNVWTIATKPYPSAHFATFPPELPTRCIRAGCPPTGIVIDPFFGSGTVGMVAEREGRRWIGIDISAEYCAIARKRTAQQGLALEATE